MSKNKKNLYVSLKTRQRLQGLAFLSFWIIGFLVFTLYPFVYSFFLSLNEVTVGARGITTVFIGFLNYKNAFTQDLAFLSTFSDYLSSMIVYVPVIIIMSLIIALLLKNKIRGTGIFRTIFFLPVVITSGPVIAKITDMGLGSLANADKLIDIAVLYDTIPAFLAKAIEYLMNQFIMILWFSGVQILIFLSGMQKIDKSMYEAAHIDGASAWESFWKITMPVINPFMTINVLYTVVMQSLFSLSPVIIKISAEMQSVEPGHGYGYASAIAWMYLVVMIAVFAVFFLLFHWWDRDTKRQLKGNAV